MPSRQYHGKNRHGCKTCKKRKVRCDLGRPICANCTRLSRECVYAEQLVPDAATPEQLETAAQLIRPPLAPPRSPASSSDTWAPTPLDLELVHHFTAFTAAGMTDNPALHHLWMAVIPKMAFSHPFLLYGVLSIAALHRRSQAPEFQQSNLLEIARDHQQQALSEYIPVLANITPDNCHALFAFSQIIATVSYALLQLSRGQNSARDFIQGVIAVFDLLIGATVIAGQAREALRAGPLAAMMGHGPSLLDWNMVPLTSDEEAKTSAFAALLERMQNVQESGRSASEVPLPSEKAKSYVLAIEKLLPLFPRHPEITPHISTVIGWCVFLDIGFIDMLKAEEDAALVVLAYYGVALNKLEHVWWLSGLGRRIVEAVGEMVGGRGKWTESLSWPRGEVGLGKSGGLL